MTYVKGVTYVTYFADWGDTLFETKLELNFIIGIWKIVTHLTNVTQKVLQIKFALKVMNINVFGRVQYFADCMCDMYDMFDIYVKTFEVFGCSDVLFRLFWASWFL